MRDPLHQLSVKHKLTLLVLGVCLLAFGVGGYVVSDSAKSALEDEIVKRLQFQGGAYATALDSRLRLLTSRVQDFASDGHIRRHAKEITTASGEQLKQLREELARHLTDNKLPLEPAFSYIAVVTRAGDSVFGTPLAPDVETLARAITSDTDVAYGGLDQSRGHRLSLLVSTPLLDLNSPTRVGRLFVRVRAGAWIYGALASLTHERQDQATVILRLVDRSGRAVVVPETWTDPSARPGPEVAREGTGLRLIDNDRSVAADSARIAPVRGVFTRTFPIATNGWRVHVELRASRLLAAVSGLQSRMLGFAVLLAALASTLLYFPLRYLARPLALLERAAQRIRDGDLEVRVAVDSTDEIGELGASFNAMAEALQERQTALRTKQAQLRTEHDRLNAVIASMRDGLVVLDPDGNLVLSNAAAKPFLDQLESREGSPHNLCRLNGKAQNASCIECFYGADSPSKACLIDLGHTVYELHATPLRSGPDGREGRVVLISDVSDRIDRDQTQIHNERLAVLGEVAAVMAHELNNPLTSITMFNQMLGSALPDDSPLQENVQVIGRNTRACKHAIRELLDYATGASPEHAVVDIRDTLDSVVHFLRPLMERSGVEIESRSTAERSTITGDEVQIRQVFVNLMMNALQAIGSDGGVIELRTTSDDTFLWIDVVDNGPGIPEDMRELVFRPFFTSKPRGAGTGLGLPTSKRILEMHGGNLELVMTQPGRTVFRARLRLAEAARTIDGVQA